MILGGSTNAVLHLIAMAHSVGIKLDIDDFQNVSDQIPFLADIKPSGKYVMEDVYKLGGVPSKNLPLCILNDINSKNRFTQRSLHFCSKTNSSMVTT
jgi:dihydroxy-acid dehydratase